MKQWPYFRRVRNGEYEILPLFRPGASDSTPVQQAIYRQASRFISLTDLQPKFFPTNPAPTRARDAPDSTGPRAGRIRGWPRGERDALMPDRDAAPSERRPKR